MKKQSTTIISNLCWSAVFVILLLLVTQVIPRALGQRGQQAISKRPSQVEEPLRLGGATWTLTGDLNTARFLHTATVLPSGMVLVAGGLDNTFNATPSTELYDPAS